MIVVGDASHDGACVDRKTPGESFRDECRHDRVAPAREVPLPDAPQRIAHIRGIERAVQRRKPMMPCPRAVIEIPGDGDESLDVGPACRNECRHGTAAGVSDKGQLPR